MKRQILSMISGAITVIALAFTITGGYVWAANTPTVTQTISTSALAADIRDASMNPVANPTFALGSLNFSFTCGVSTGTLGSNSQRVYVDNPGSADNGWAMTIAATDGATATWENSGQTDEFDFNDPTAAGCTDGADADSVGGQLTLDPNAGTLTADCVGCTTTNIAKGSSAAFSQGATDSVTLLNAASGSDDVGRWYMTGVGLSQTIPGGQPATDYALNLTITVAAS